MRNQKAKTLLLRSGLSIACFVILAIFLCVVAFPVSAAAEETEETDVAGKIYEFDKDSHYEFPESGTSAPTTSDNTYGSFYLSGNVSATGTKSGVPCYEVFDGELDLVYQYADTRLNAGEDAWHLIDDKSNKVADMKLDSDIMKGAIILQTSKDNKNWVDIKAISNVFSDTPICTNALYSAADVELLNGCFYRVIVVYELRIRTEESNFFFINTDKHDYRKYAEVYEFYAYTNSGISDEVDSEQTYSLGQKVRVKNFDGYFGEELIKQDDPHYGWDLGEFFVSGYTDEVVKEDGNVVFLKNLDDKVTLWFRLNQDIHKLNENENLSITPDSEGYDQYFETPTMDFGHGALMIRYTDHNNVRNEPVIYTNYLEANVSPGADTKVQLFEEGDYEVALDYEITSDEFINKIGHYRIFFKFSVRNGNCMIYPFDIAAGNELTNNSMTENGFRLDLALSRYLKINIRREVLTAGADGLVEDTRFNGVAKDGAEYTDDGIYTITVSNEYTGQLTTKKIYVGTNNILRAHMKTGLSIPEINELIDDGATIFEDGTIELAAIKPVEYPAESVQPQTDEQVPEDIDVPETSDPEKDTDAPTESMSRDHSPVPVLIVISAIVLITISILLLIVQKRKNNLSKKTSADTDNEDEGDAAL